MLTTFSIVDSLKCNIITTDITTVDMIKRDVYGNLNSLVTFEMYLEMVL